MQMRCSIRKLILQITHIHEFLLHIIRSQNLVLEAGAMHSIKIKTTTAAVQQTAKHANHFRSLTFYYKQMRFLWLL